MRSMTGYGMGQFQNENIFFKVEIKSVNSRYSEFNIRMPKTLIAFEDRVRKLLKEEISRGKVDVYINYNFLSQSDTKVVADAHLAGEYLKAFEDLRDELGLISEISLRDIYTMEGVISTISNDDDKEELWEPLKSAVTIALNQFVEARELEGAALKADFEEKLKDITACAEYIRDKASSVIEENTKKLRENIEKNLNKDELDLQRLTTEVAIMCDKLSIDEEIVRIFSHLLQFNDIINRYNSIGRNLDFLVQELNREVNTVGSKTGDIEILNKVVELKSHIEKLREQIQNIE